MKKLHRATALFFLFSVVFAGCKKDNDNPGSAPPANAFTPTCAYFSQENQGGVWKDFVYFFDLSETDNAKKMYFVAKAIYANKDTMELVLEPGSIDRLGANFPSEITSHPGFGWVKQWTNPSYRLKFNGSFYKEPIVTGSGYAFLNQSGTLGSLAGKWPQAEIKFYLKEPLGNGTLLHHYAYFYFTEDRCYHSSVLVSTAGNTTYQTYAVRPISSIMAGFAKYDWKNVSSYFALYKSYNDRQTHYFLDFKNWRYFTVEEGASSVGLAGTQPTITFGDYKSLDRLIKWPAGWGKAG